MRKRERENPSSVLCGHDTTFDNRARVRERARERERDGERESERARESERERERERASEKESKREREGEREKEMSCAIYIHYSLHAAWIQSCEAIDQKTMTSCVLHVPSIRAVVAVIAPSRVDSFHLFHGCEGTKSHERARAREQESKRARE